MQGVRAAIPIAVGVLALGVAAYWTLLFFLQRPALFPGSRAADGRAVLDRAGGEQIWLEPPGGRVEAWLLPASESEQGRSPLVVYAHGNGELIDDWADAFAPLREWGFAVLLVEYPGYGRSAGQPSQASITAAMVAAYDRVASRPEVDPARIVGYGRSLGGGAVCALSRERPLAALVLESTFASVRRIAQGFGLPGFLVRDPFDNDRAVRVFAGPILLVHGERDEVVPARHAAVLHAAAPRSLLHLVACGHNDCPRPWDALRGFLAEHGLLAPARAPHAARFDGGSPAR
jgi:fermentation-respiration switch protein FrsA (DUF1100 family)